MRDYYGRRVRNDCVVFTHVTWQPTLEVPRYHCRLIDRQSYTGQDFGQFYPENGGSMLPLKNPGASIYQTAGFFAQFEILSL